MGQLPVREAENVALDIKFRKSIEELSDNRFLMRPNDTLRPHLTFDGNFVRNLGMAVERKDKGMTEKHLAIIEAIASGDAGFTLLALDSHIGGSKRRNFKGQPWP